MFLSDEWQPISTATLDRLVRVYAPAYEGLPSIECTAQYHEDAGWCVDELRQVTHWRVLTQHEQILWAGNNSVFAEWLESWRLSACECCGNTLMCKECTSCNQARKDGEEFVAKHGMPRGV